MKNMNSKVFLLQGKLTDQRMDVITVYQTFLQKKKCRSNGIYRGSYMSAHVLLNLLNLLQKSDKILGKPRILLLFLNFF